MEDLTEPYWKLPLLHLPVEPTPPENAVSKQDLEDIKQLVESFRAELGGADLKLDLL